MSSPPSCQHRIELPDDEDLLGELASVRLRKNGVGIYRFDHDSGAHDDQAVALALGRCGPGPAAARDWWMQKLRGVRVPTAGRNRLRRSSNRGSSSFM